MSSTKLHAAIGLTAFGLIASGCAFIAGVSGPRVVGTGPVVKQKRTVSAFTRISVGMGTTIQIEVGPVASVEIEAQDNVGKAIETKVNGDTLVVDAKGSLTSNVPIKLHITTPSLEGIQIRGSADVRANKFTAKTLDVEIDGSGDIALEGSCEDLSITINGSGTIDMSKFAAKTAAVDINGSGHVKVDVKDTLSAAINGAGDVVYTGMPKVKKDINGSGSIDPA